MLETKIKEVVTMPFVVSVLDNQVGKVGIRIEGLV